MTRSRLVYAMAWRDLRNSFVAAAIFVAVFAASLAGTFKLARSAAASGDKNPIWAQLANAPNAYERYVDAIWFHVPGASFVIALAGALMATAIPLRGREANTAFVLLLPFTRWEILRKRLILFVTLLFALSVIVCATFAILGWILAARTYPLGKALAATVLFTIGALGWAGVGAAIASFVPPAIAAGIVITIVYLLPIDLFTLTLPPDPGAAGSGMLNMWAMTDSALWSSSIPWVQTGLTLVVALVGCLIASRRFQRIDAGL
jgi:hypothetical protein